MTKIAFLEFIAPRSLSLLRFRRGNRSVKRRNLLIKRGMQQLTSTDEK